MNSISVNNFNMENYKLIEERIKIDKINKDGKVFERGKPDMTFIKCYSLENLCHQLDFQATD